MNKLELYNYWSVTGDIIAPVLGERVGVPKDSGAKKKRKKRKVAKASKRRNRK